MTIVTDSRSIRKALLGFLLAARLDHDNDPTWRKDTEGQDIFDVAEEWEQQSRDEVVPRPKLTREAKQSGNNARGTGDEMTDASGGCKRPTSLWQTSTDILQSSIMIEDLSLS